MGGQGKLPTPDDLGVTPAPGPLFLPPRLTPDARQVHVESSASFLISVMYSICLESFND